MQNHNIHKTTKIFIQNVTLLDCALLTPNSPIPIGKSWSVDIIWEGKKDDNGFIFDFSLAKKNAKQTIDEDFDHKLLICEEQIYYQSETRIVSGQVLSNINNNSLFAINTYKSSTKKVPKNVLLGIEKQDISLLETELATQILKKSPQNIVNVSVILREHEKNSDQHYFSYTHSLCTHCGNCQRFHGHSNIVEVMKNGHFDMTESSNIAKRLNNNYIISKNYIQKKWDSPLIKEIVLHFPMLSNSLDNAKGREELLAAQYTGSQGDVAVILPAKYTLSIEGESTIENIAEFIRKQFPFKENIEIRAYEGLSKGSICS